MKSYFHHEIREGYLVQWCFIYKPKMAEQIFTMSMALTEQSTKKFNKTYKLKIILKTVVSKNIFAAKVSFINSTSFTVDNRRLRFVSY